MRLNIAAASPDQHTHGPDTEGVEAIKILARIKSQAAENFAVPPSHLLKNLPNVPESVASRLPDEHNIKKQIQRHRSKMLPANPKSLADLHEIPRQFSTTSICFYTTIQKTMKMKRYHAAAS